MIYIVEDDVSIRELVVYTLKNTGFEACGFGDAEEYFEALNQNIPELTLLDIMLPGMDGIEILKKLKASPNTQNIPVIMLTAKGTEYDKVIGLDNGADDYISKPFGMMELISRVRAVLRRSTVNTKSQELRMNNITVNIDKHSVNADGKEVVLTLKEFELLCYLIQNSGIVLTRDKILSKIWGYDFGGETRTVDVHIGTLRQKLGECGNDIETVRGVGYRLGGVK